MPQVTWGPLNTMCGFRQTFFLTLWKYRWIYLAKHFSLKHWSIFPPRSSGPSNMAFIRKFSFAEMFPEVYSTHVIHWETSNIFIAVMAGNKTDIKRCFSSNPLLAEIVRSGTQKLFCSEIVVYIWAVPIIPIFGACLVFTQKGTQAILCTGESFLYSNGREIEWVFQLLMISPNFHGHSWFYNYCFKRNFVPHPHVCLEGKTIFYILAVSMSAPLGSSIFLMLL